MVINNFKLNFVAILFFYEKIFKFLYRTKQNVNIKSHKTSFNYQIHIYNRFVLIKKWFF